MKFKDHIITKVKGYFGKDHRQVFECKICKVIIESWSIKEARDRHEKELQNVLSQK